MCSIPVVSKRPAKGARGVFFCYALPALDKNSYLKRVDAPVGVKPALRCWMELN
ncbi:MAG: hypothetical protein HYY28_01725 [Betaproteobacteria bacterium]|nr:hypothetical protein [Betaproteobacteria bacterium]MBI2959007.1 hypothetical protein [Betaproteobacteria bacterium]